MGESERIWFNFEIVKTTDALFTDEHFNLHGHSVNDIRLFPLELIHANRDSVRKRREAHLNVKANTLEQQVF